MRNKNSQFASNADGVGPCPNKKNRRGWHGLHRHAIGSHHHHDSHIGIGHDFHSRANETSGNGMWGDYAYDSTGTAPASMALTSFPSFLATNFEVEDDILTCKAGDTPSPANFSNTILALGSSSPEKNWPYLKPQDLVTVKMPTQSRASQAPWNYNSQLETCNDCGSSTLSKYVNTESNKRANLCGYWFNISGGYNVALPCELEAPANIIMLASYCPNLFSEGYCKSIFSMATYQNPGTPGNKASWAKDGQPGMHDPIIQGTTSVTGGNPGGLQTIKYLAAQAHGSVNWVVNSTNGSRKEPIEGFPITPGQDDYDNDTGFFKRPTNGHRTQKAYCLISVGGSSYGPPDWLALAIGPDNVMTKKGTGAGKCPDLSYWNRAIDCDGGTGASGQFNEECKDIIHAEPHLVGGVGGPHSCHCVAGAAPYFLNGTTPDSSVSFGGSAKDGSLLQCRAGVCEIPWYAKGDNGKGVNFGEDLRTAMLNICGRKTVDSWQPNNESACNEYRPKCQDILNAMKDLKMARGMSSDEAEKEVYEDVNFQNLCIATSGGTPDGRCASNSGPTCTDTIDAYTLNDFGVLTSGTSEQLYSISSHRGLQGPNSQFCKDGCQAPYYIQPGATTCPEFSGNECPCQDGARSWTGDIESYIDPMVGSTGGAPGCAGQTGANPANATCSAAQYCGPTCEEIGELDNLDDDGGRRCYQVGCKYTPPGNANCKLIPDGFPNAGQLACCPAGWEPYGNGSACREVSSGNECDLFSNPTLGCCSDSNFNPNIKCGDVVATPAPPNEPQGNNCKLIPVGFPNAGQLACCPAGWEPYGNGSACREVSSGNECDLFSNPTLGCCSYANFDSNVKCCGETGATGCVQPSGTACRTIPDGFPNAGQLACCPAGWEPYGNDSACREVSSGNECNLFSNPTLGCCSNTNFDSNVKCATSTKTVEPPTAGSSGNKGKCEEPPITLREETSVPCSKSGGGASSIECVRSLFAATEWCKNYKDYYGVLFATIEGEGDNPKLDMNNMDHRVQCYYRMLIYTLADGFDLDYESPDQLGLMGIAMTLFCCKLKWLCGGPGAFKAPGDPITSKATCPSVTCIITMTPLSGSSYGHPGYAIGGDGGNIADPNDFFKVTAERNIIDEWAFEGDDSTTPGYNTCWIPLTSQTSQVPSCGAGTADGANAFCIRSPATDAQGMEKEGAYNYQWDYANYPKPRYGNDDKLKAAEGAMGWIYQSFLYADCPYDYVIPMLYDGGQYPSCDKGLKSNCWDTEGQGFSWEGLCSWWAYDENECADSFTQGTPGAQPLVIPMNSNCSLVAAFIGYKDKCTFCCKDLEKFANKWWLRDVDDDGRASKTGNNRIDGVVYFYLGDTSNYSQRHIYSLLQASNNYLSDAKIPSWGLGGQGYVGKGLTMGKCTPACDLFNDQKTGSICTDTCSAQGGETGGGKGMSLCGGASDNSCSEAAWNRWSGFPNAVSMQSNIYVPTQDNPNGCMGAQNFLKNSAGVPERMTCLEAQLKANSIQGDYTSLPKSGTFGPGIPSDDIQYYTPAELKDSEGKIEFWLTSGNGQQQQCVLSKCLKGTGVTETEEILWGPGCDGSVLNPSGLWSKSSQHYGKNFGELANDACFENSIDNYPETGEEPDASTSTYYKNGCDYVYQKGKDDPVEKRTEKSRDQLIHDASQAISYDWSPPKPKNPNTKCD
ncbi:MAG: hypothetical protein ACXABD_08195 [Candidatus Thorarchaeota archaeon]